MMPELEEGEWILWRNMGAYTSAATWLSLWLACWPVDFLHLSAWPFSGVDPGGLQLQWFRAAEGMVLPQLGHVGAFLDLLSPWNWKTWNLVTCRILPPKNIDSTPSWHKVGKVWMRGSSWSVKIKRTCFVGDLLLTSLAFGHFYFHLSQILVVARKKFPEAYLPMTSSRAKRQAARLQTSKSEPARFAHWKPLVFGRIRNLWALFVLVCCFACFRICIWGVLDHTATTQVWQVRLL